MVLSGFDSKTRTWVSAYKLSLHLGVAAWLFAYLFKTYLHVSIEKTYDFDIKKHYTFSKIVLITVFIQILLGGLMAGMHAGIIHAHFPFFMGENSLVNTLLANTNFSKNTFLDYEKNNFIKALVQVFHRGFAWFILVLTIIFSYTLLKKNISKKLTIAVYLLIVVILIQFSLGVFTILNILDKDITLYLGVSHQAFAFISLILWVYVSFLLNPKHLHNKTNV